MSRQTNIRKFKIYRFNPETDKKPYMQDYELDIVSHRVENVPGTHAVKYESEIDKIELIHTAKSRVGFAKGAVLAAEWLTDKKGVFTMSDRLKDVKFEGFAK